MLPLDDAGITTVNMFFGKTIQEARSMPVTRKVLRWTEDPTLKGKRER